MTTVLILLSIFSLVATILVLLAVTLSGQISQEQETFEGDDDDAEIIQITQVRF